MRGRVQVYPDSVLLLQEKLPFAPRCALFSASDALVNSAVRHGLSLVPFEYVLATQVPSRPPAPRRRPSGRCRPGPSGRCRPGPSGRCRPGPTVRSACAEARRGCVAPMLAAGPRSAEASQPACAGVRGLHSASRRARLPRL